MELTNQGLKLIDTLSKLNHFLPSGVTLLLSFSWCCQYKRPETNSFYIHLQQRGLFYGIAQWQTFLIPVLGKDRQVDLHWIRHQLIYNSESQDKSYRVESAYLKKLKVKLGKPILIFFLQKCKHIFCYK